jgi:hypothetical protein
MAISPAPAVGAGAKKQLPATAFSAYSNSSMEPVAWEAGAKPQPGPLGLARVVVHDTLHARKRVPNREVLANLCLPENGAHLAALLVVTTHPPTAGVAQDVAPMHGLQPAGLYAPLAVPQPLSPGSCPSDGVPALPLLEAV